VSRLLIVHHTVSPATRALYESVLDGTRAEGIVGVDVESRPALSAPLSETLTADGVLIGATANIGYLAGAVKHWFDTIYYPLLDARPGLPYGFWMHGNEDTAGAVHAMRSIIGALRWQQAAESVIVLGAPTAADRQACWDLGATLAATIAG
jgi:multimeric flavodoxin WrbA